MHNTLKNGTANCEFIPDGYGRARRAVENAVRQQVVAEFAGRPQPATLWGRIQAWRAIEREVHRRIGKLAPPAAHY